MMEQTFRTIVTSCPAGSGIVDALWSEIRAAYDSKNRHYHNLVHLDQIVKELSAIKENLGHWRAVILAVAYHDLVYDVSQKDNEEKSAAIARDRCSQLNLPQVETWLCSELILATKNHEKNIQADINYFTDADLSILGAEPEIYENYKRQIRKEYAVYPDLLYRAGRKKVLERFLSMPVIFKTDIFSRKYEEQARENINDELRKL